VHSRSLADSTTQSGETKLETSSFPHGKFSFVEKISALPTNEARNGSQRLATDSMPTLQDIRGTYTQKAAGLPSSPVLRELHRLATLFIGHVITPDLRTII